MASQIERVANELRQRVLSGSLVAGQRVLEVQFSRELGVSRTPLRLALGELEKQGLLERLPTRGYRVRSVTLNDVAMALEVRGTLEGMAARLVAESGMAGATKRLLHDCVRSGGALIEEARRNSCPLDTVAWASMNAQFHDALVAAAGNAALTAALEHVGKTPMVRPGELWLGGGHEALALAFVQRAQFDHEEVLQAIAAREGLRAEYLMREHARRSADNKRALAAALHAGGVASVALAMPTL